MIFRNDISNMNYSLKEKAVSGVKWSAFSQATNQIVTFAVSILLARLLMPEDFGILGMAIFFTGFIAIFNEFGIGSAVIQNQDLDQEDLSSIFWLNIMIGFSATLLTIAIAPLVAAFYDREILFSIVSVLSIGFIMTAFSNVQRSLLLKDVNLKRLAVFEVSCSLISGVVAIAMAWYDLGVWSLVSKTIVFALVMNILLWPTSSWRPRWSFQWSRARRILRFSLGLVGFNTVNYFARNADYLLIGKFLGPTSLGYYTLAYRLLMFPLQNISSVLGRVFFPVFSKIQNDNPRFRRAYLKATRFIALLSFPIMLGLFIVSDELIFEVFGAKWEPAIPLIKIFCFVGLVQSIGATVGQIYLAKGRTDWMFGWGIFSSIIAVGSIVLGLRWGIYGVAICYAISSVIILSYPNFAIPFHFIALRMKGFIMNFGKEILTSLIMFILVYLLVWFQRKIGLPSKIILMDGFAFGVVIYIIAVRFLNWEIVKEGYSLIKKQT